jgi:glycerol-3-phosphate dehydrogenase (NAD(P)+)
MSERALQVGVLGAGNWGTTLAQLVATKGHATQLWCRDPEQRHAINEQHTSEVSVPGLVLSGKVHAEAELAPVVAGSDLLLMAIPSQAFREVCRQLATVVPPDLPVVHCTKGFENDSNLRMSEILVRETCVRQFGVLSGPNIATEIARGKPAGTVVATRFPRIARLVRRALASSQLRIFDSDDLRGVELCGALKNVVAIAAGMANEMQAGDNAKAFLITRGMTEMMQLAFALGAQPATAAGLAGIGDLMATCASPYSRNHRVGAALARGIPLASVLHELGMVAEGVYAARSACALARAGNLRVPLFEHIERVLHEDLPAAKAVAALMELPTGRDVPRFGGQQLLQ